MIILRIAINSIGRFATRKLTRLALVALLIIPLLYSSLYLYANSDPYTNLKNVPVAIVNNDTGTVSTSPGDEDASTNPDLPKNMGVQLVESLQKDGTFDWQLADAADVEQKVFDGEYAFAMIIGEDFTDNINKLAKFDAVQTEMELILNDANSYVLHEIAEQLEFRVTSEVAGQISKQVMMLQLAGIAEIRASLVKAGDGAAELAAGLATASDGSDKLKAGVEEFAGGLLQVKKGIDELNTSVKALPAALKQLKNGSAQLKSGLDQVNSITKEVDGYEVKVNKAWNKIVAELRTLINQSDLPDDIKADLLAIVNEADQAVTTIHLDISQYANAIDQLDTGAGQLDSGIGQLQKADSKLVAGIQKLDDGVDLLQSNFGKIVVAVTQLSNGLKELAAGADTLEDGLKTGVDSLPNLTEAERKNFVDVVVNPLTFKTNTVAAAMSYAIGLAPFFMALAGWIGVYILFVLMPPISTRALISNVSPWKVALSGWLPPALIGIGQMSIMLVALHLIIALSPVYTLLSVLFLFLMVLTYLTIVHFLVTAWGKVGLFLGLVLMIVQLTTSGGTFPWQTMPEVDQFLHSFLPMAHAVDGLRNLLYGGSLEIASQKAMVLFAYFAAFAGLDLLAVSIRQRWSMKLLFPAL
ncbi:MAG: YhgE/Pip family protein [Propionibacteriaceae bacterium]|jgi:putative membrane protein|nr:YhgE/Pip family protein [Propionibacteriaceae bacterium]